MIRLGAMLLIVPAALAMSAVMAAIGSKPQRVPVRAARKREGGRRD